MVEGIRDNQINIPWSVVLLPQGQDTGGSQSRYLPCEDFSGISAGLATSL